MRTPDSNPTQGISLRYLQAGTDCLKGQGQPPNPPASSPGGRTHGKTYRLFFGLQRADGTLVTECEWEVFENQNLAACFPDGYTVEPAQGSFPGAPKPGRVVTVHTTAARPLRASTLAALALCWSACGKRVHLWVAQGDGMTTKA